MPLNSRLVFLLSGISPRLSPTVFPRPVCQGTSFRPQDQNPCPPGRPPFNSQGLPILTGHKIASGIDCVECRHIRRPLLAWYIRASQSADRRTPLGHNRTECQRGCGETCRRSVPKAAAWPPDPPAIYFRATRRRILDAAGRGCKTLLTRRPADAAPEEMTWPCCLRSCDGEADRARGNNEILLCQGRCQRRNKQREGACGRIREGIAGGHASTLLRRSRSMRPRATSGDLVDYETLVMGRNSWRYDVLRPLPLSEPLFFVSAIA